MAYSVRVWAVFIMTSWLWLCVATLPPKARILVQYPLSESDNSSAIEVLSDVGDTETVLTEQTVSGNIYLECIAPYPIEWIYEGDGFPGLLTFVETRRVVNNFSDPSTYTFSVRVDLLAVKESTTGLYSCRKLGTPQVRTYFQIYVPGKNVFLSQVAKKAIADPSGPIVTIPCAVTHPNTKVNLFRVSGAQGTLDILNDVPFVPSEGFKLNTTDYPYPILGHYICMATKEKKVLKVLLEAPKSTLVRANPPRKHIARNRNVTQVFKCEGKENVTILVSGESGENPPQVKYEESEVAEAKFPYIATLEIGPNEFPDENFTGVNCVTADGHKILHTWEYTYYGDEDLTFSYDVVNSRFLCCTPSFHRPEIVHVPCSSPMECQIKKHFCVRNKEKCSERQQYYLEGIPEHCVASPEPEEHKEDGMLMCSVGETTKEYYFAWGNGKRNEPILSFDQITSNEEIIEIRTNHTGDIFAGQEVEISCHPSPFFFSKEPIWAFERLNSSIEIVDKSLIRDDLYFEKRVTIPKRRRTVKFPDTDIRALICLAPSWYSAREWKNVSIPVKVLEGEIGVQQTTIIPEFEL